MQGPTEAARAMRHRPGFAWLDSSLPGPDSVSILACEPDAILSGRDWGALENELRRRKRGGFDLGFPDGAAIGWVDFDGWFHFGFYDKLHVYNHAREAWVGAVPEFFDEAPPGPVEPLRFETLTGKGGFVEMVRRAKEYVAAGDIYQVCLSRAFEADGAGDAWGFYEALRHYSPAPQSAFLDAGGLQIASASPECFLKMSGRRIATRPIKGTRPRHADPQRDLLSAHELMTSPKEIAELVMITDMERNDLGRVCEYGSIRVPELLHLESYEQVFHLVSTVEGQLRGGVGHADALRACFPGGSISGAPKKRALEIIRELEPVPRGIYTGAIGYFGYNGESRFSIAIRTVVFQNGTARFHSGAGIVADSCPEREWEETGHKAAGILLAAQRPLQFPHPCTASS
jgi:anthranilate/para-aminobenzoate synthase component I